jgi:hypothetical protein
MRGWLDPCLGKGCSGCHLDRSRRSHVDGLGWSCVAYGKARG